MKKSFRTSLLMILGAALLTPATLLAQSGEKEKSKDKEKKDSEVITIIRKGDKNEKVVVEVDGDKVTVNGKPIEEYEGEDVKVKRSKIKDAYALTEAFGHNNWQNFGENFNMGRDNFNFRSATIDSNRAMLGVTTEKAEKGVEIQEITKESGASKAGLKEGDVITKIDDRKIETPDDLSKAIRSHKPGDKVSVTYYRDEKEQKTTAELGRWKGAIAYASPGQYKFDLGDIDKYMPKIQTVPGYRSQNWGYSSGSPKLGLSVQDTDDGKGVKVIEVDEESNAAKAGIKENDVILDVDSKATNSADEIAKIIKESKDKNSIMVKILRDGKSQNISVKIPRKLKTADL